MRARTSPILLAALAAGALIAAPAVGQQQGGQGWFVPGQGQGGARPPARQRTTIVIVDEVPTLPAVS